MSLSEQIQEDNALFFDPDDMAEVHKIQLPGEMSVRDIAVIVDNDQLQQNSLKSPGGTYNGKMLFYVPKTEVPGLVEQALIQFDGVPYLVSEIVDEDKILQVTLDTNMGGF